MKIVWIVTLRDDTFCCAYASRNIALAWMMAGMEASFVWKDHYKLFSTFIADSMPGEL